MVTRRVSEVFPLKIGLFWEFSGRDKNTVQARRASECIVQFQGMHLLAPRACILGVFIKQLGLSGIQATEVALSNLPIEATKTREEPFCWPVLLVFLEARPSV